MSVSPFDLFDPAVQVDPFGTYRALREEGPVLVLDPGSAAPTVVVSHHAAARAVLGDPASYSSRLLELPALLFLDPPDHDRVRRIVSRAFTARAIADLAPGIEAISRDLVRDYAASGGGDLISEVAGRIPVYVIGQVLGVPTDRWEELREWSEATVRALALAPGAPDAEAILNGAIALHGYLADVVDAAASAGPSDTIVGRLVAAELTGEIERDELVAFAQLLFVAGHETTTALLAHTVERLASDRRLWTTVAADRDLVAPLIEEVLRTRGPLQRLFRRTTRPVELAGVTLPEGATVVVLIGSANRDRAAHPVGDGFDIDEADSAHLAFGHGIHRCLGAPLARLEARIAVEVLLDELADVALDPGDPPVRFSGGTSSELQTTRLPLLVATRGGRP